jgi:predicted lipase
MNYKLLIDQIQEVYKATNDIFWLRTGATTIAFRGTEDVADWMVNLDINRVEYNIKVNQMLLTCGMVHEGFLGRWRKLRAGVLECIKSNGIQRPIIVGHSLGGAMANFCAVELKLLGYSPHLVTFGCPRTGDNNFARFMNYNVKQHTRIVNWGDPVTRIPSAVAGWRHSGKLLRVGNMANLVKLPHTRHHGCDEYRKVV